MYGNFGRQSLAPVKVDEQIDVKIEAVGEKGDGVTKIKGFVIFVPNTKAGDEVRIKITKVFKNVGFGEVLGKAEGPIAVEEAPAPRQAYVPDVQPEAPAEDTEDFGEEPAEEVEPEAPAEEEVPAEEKKEE